MRAIIANAGNANAFTGKLGDRSVDESTRAVAQTIGCSRNEVFMASTGVIGQPMTMLDSDQHGKYQRNAPRVEADLYLVPKVIE